MKTNCIYNNNLKNSRLITGIYFFMAVVSSIICTIILLLDVNKPEYYSFIPLLPLTFCICSYIAMNKYKYLFKKISITLLIMTYYFRMVVLPFVTYRGNYTMTIIRTSVVSIYMKPAILLMCYETVIVFVVLAISRIKEDVVINDSIQVNKFTEKKSTIFKIIFVGILLFMIVSLVLYPELINYVSFFLTTSKEAAIIRANNRMTMSMVVPPVLYRIYICLFNFMQIIIPILLLEVIYKRWGIRKVKFALFLTFILVSNVFLFMTSEKAISVILAMVLFFITRVIYKKQMKKIMPIIIIIFCILTILGLILKSGINYSEYGFWESLSSILNSYFGGVPNVSVSMAMKDSGSLKLIISDMLSSIPFINYFFKDCNTSVKIFNSVLYGGGTNTDQIIPMIGQGYVYFGFVFAPLFSVLCSKFAIVLENSANKTYKMFNKYIYLFCTVLVVVSPSLYNFNILISFLVKIFILLVIMKLSHFNILKVIVFYKNVSKKL